MTPEERKWPDEPVPCRFGCTGAVVLVATPGGCVCFPDDREQYLCAHHVYKYGFIESPELLAEAAPGVAEWVGL